MRYLHCALCVCVCVRVCSVYWTVLPLQRVLGFCDLFFLILPNSCVENRVFGNDVVLV